MASRFGNRLIELRRTKGLTLREAGEASGVNYTYISRLEQGERIIYSPAARPKAAETIRRLADAYKLAGEDSFNELMALATVPDDAPQEVVKAVSLEFMRTFGKSKSSPSDSKRTKSKRR